MNGLRLLACLLVIAQGGDMMFLSMLQLTQVTRVMFANSAVELMNNITAHRGKGIRHQVRQESTLDSRAGEINMEIESSASRQENRFTINYGTTHVRNLPSENMPDNKEKTTEANRTQVGVSVTFQLFPMSDRSWFGAEAECQEWGGTLAVPDSPVKVTQMRELLLQHNRRTGEDSAAFLGFNDLEAEGHFVTVSGSPLFPSNKSMWSPDWFRADQPDDDKSWTKDGEDCGSLMPNGGINDVPCVYNLPFICEFSKYNEESHGSYSDDDGTLRFFSLRKDWFTARDACGLWGGHLAIPDSEEKVLKMTKIFKSQHRNQEYSCAFLGFSDIANEGEFITINGKQVFNVNATWNPSWFSETQPDDNRGWSEDGEDCGSLHLSGGLNDVPCRYSLPFFCEKSSQRTVH